MRVGLTKMISFANGAAVIEETILDVLNHDPFFSKNC
jgi:hypothetical protein